MISSHQEEFLVKKFECRDVFLKSNSQIIRYTCLSCVLFVIAYSVTANVGAINLKSIGGLMSSPGILGLCLLVISATLLLNALRWLLILNSLGHTSSFYQVLGFLAWWFNRLNHAGLSRAIRVADTSFRCRLDQFDNSLCS